MFLKCEFLKKGFKGGLIFESEINDKVKKGWKMAKKW